jgi:hypothetical protein
MDHGVKTDVFDRTTISRITVRMMRFLISIDAAWSGRAGLAMAT